MAVQNWTNIAAYVGGYNLACRAKSFEAPTTTVAELDTTSLCDTWEQKIGGLKSTTWNAEVMQDFDTDQVDQLLGLSQLGEAFPISVAPAGVTEGDVAYTFRARMFEYSPLQASAGEIAMASLTGAGSGSPTVRGTVMNDAATAVTSSGTSTGVQVGAVSSTQTMYAALHVLEASVADTLDVVIESDNNAGFTSDTDRITFTQASGITSEWASVPGAITDDYWRVRYTVGGSSPSFTFVVVIGVAST